MTDKVNRKQLLIRFTQILVQSGYLTWCTREQDLTPLLEKTLGILVGMVYPSLYIFGSHETISLLAPFYENPYMKAFLKNISLRPSCHACKANAGRSFSDLTLADFWGVETIFPHLDDDKGTGLVLVQSEKGDRLLEHPQLHSLQTSYELIKPLNPCCYQSVASHPKRDFFFQNLEKKPFTTLVATCTRPSIRQRFGLYKAYLIKLFKNPFA